MTRKDTLTKLLATTGTVLAWLPLLAPLVLGLISLGVDGVFRFDWLMPAELFLVALAGGLLLLWAALRARSRLWLIGGGLAVAAASLLGTQGLAVVTGLAHGDAEPTGWRLALVLATLALYVLALVVVAVAGVLLVRDLFRSPTPASGAGT